MWFDDNGALLPGLLPGLYRGITFYTPDTSTTAGRRAVEYLFPGVDLASYDDFGQHPNEVEINGLIVGDDYIAQGQALAAAFNTAGPATLVHPFLGPMTVILVDPGQVSFSEKELRVVRFNVTFKRIDAGGVSGLGFGLSIGSLTGLTTAIGAVTTAAATLASAVDTGVMSIVRMKAASRSHRIVATAVAGLATPIGARRAVSRLKASLPRASIGPSAFDAMVAGICSQISTHTATSFVSPAAEAQLEAPPSSAALVAVGQALTSSLLPEIGEAPASADAALLAGAVARVLAATSDQAVFTDYDSRSDALAYRAATVSAIGTAVDAIDVIDADLLIGAAAGLRRTLQDLRSAVVADVNETIGRLPKVSVFTPGQPVDAWALAQHIAGDTPSRVEAVYADIVSRNRPRHPSWLDMARIEVKT